MLRLHNNIKLTIIVSVALAVMQTAFMFIPPDAMRLYNLVLRPLVYAVLTVAVFVFMGFDARPVRKAHSANLIAVMSVALFGIILLVASFLSGAGRNLMTANSAIVAHNLWETGSIVILGELIRFKLIKSAGQQNRVYIIAVLTVVLAYGHMNAVRMLIDGNVIVWAVFFEAIFRPLVISAVLSYFAVEGTFKSVILVSFVYKMTPYVVPVLPDISQLVWALITCGTLFVTAVIYRFVTNEKRRNMKIREKRMLKYAKKPILSNAVTVVVVAVIIAFFVGMFPVYPVVILTGSMADTAPRGSLVFVERVPPGEAFIRVGEGEVIHFLNHTGVPYVHRVVDFRWDADGNREYVTRGDASDAADPFPVPQYDVLGIVRAQLPFFGYPYIFVRSILR